MQQISSKLRENETPLAKGAFGPPISFLCVLFAFTYLLRDMAENMADLRHTVPVTLAEHWGPLPIHLALFPIGG